MNTPGTEATATQPLPADAYLTQLTIGALVTQALYVVAKLGIADLLVEGPLPVSVLAAKTKTDESALYRVLRSLAGMGIFVESQPKVFALTPYAEPLRSDVPNSMRDLVIFMGEEWHWRVWGRMLYSVQTGKPAWGMVHGSEVFDYFQSNPEQYEIFNRAMTGMSSSSAAAIVAGYDFSPIDTLVDIAGGHGLLLAQILRTNPKMKGVLFDLPDVIAGAGSLFKQENVSDRVETVSGNFFEAVPEGAEGYLMKHIIHDWDDERCISILKNIRAVMNSNAKVLIVEVVLPEGNEPHFGKLMDLEMLVSPGGIERTPNEYRDLLGRAGLHMTRIIPTKSAYSIVEAVGRK